MPLLQAFTFPSTLGEVTLHQLPQFYVLIYGSRGKWVFPTLLWSFPPKATFTSFPTLGCWVCATAPAFSSQLVRDFPFPPLRHSGSPTLFATCLFCCYCLFSFSFFPGEGWSVQGSRPGLSVGVPCTTLAHLYGLVCIFPNHLGLGIWWQHGSPPGFSV
jgi:hypothetical protein